MTKNWKLVKKYLIKFLQEEVYKTGLKKAVLGLSGGIDSAIVAVLAQEAFDDNLLTVMMPSQFSSDSSIEDAKELCQKFNIKYELISIESILNAYFNEDFSNTLRVGNFSARARMNILYDISARESALVIGTSNKSELLLGYGTLCGDLASALNPIGDLYKSEVFEFAEFLGVCNSIISKPPSADLWEGQSDEVELGFSYAKIDEFLKIFVDERFSLNKIKEMDFDDKLVSMARAKIYQNQFKRKPAIIAKLTDRTINQDFLYPRDIKL